MIFLIAALAATGWTFLLPTSIEALAPTSGVVVITGLLRGGEGNPLSNASVLATPEGSAKARDFLTGPDGGYRLGFEAEGGRCHPLVLSTNTGDPIRVRFRMASDGTPDQMTFLEGFREYGSLRRIRGPEQGERPCLGG